MGRQIKIDNKIRTDHKFPAGLMDVVTIEKTKATFRLLYDLKGRFAMHKISPEEGKYKLLRVKDVCKGSKGVTHCVTHDGRTVRFPHPYIKRNDTIKFNLETQTIDEGASHLKMEHGNM